MGLDANGISGETVDLFVTCFVDLFRPAAAIAAVRILERRGVQVRFPTNQTCCGQFSFNAGYRHEAAGLARHFVDVFQPAGSSPATPVVALSGSCAAMVREEYPRLLEEDGRDQGWDAQRIAAWRNRAEALGGRVMEFTQWLVRYAMPGTASDRGAVVHHLGCHMRRVLREVQAPVQVLQAAGITSWEPEDNDCCGFGGTYSLTEPTVSVALADAKWAQMDPLLARGAIGVASCDMGCLLHLVGRRQFLGQQARAWHVAELLDAAEQGVWPPEEGG